MHRLPSFVSAVLIKLSYTMPGFRVTANGKWPEPPALVPVSDRYSPGQPDCRVPAAPVSRDVLS